MESTATAALSRRAAETRNRLIAAGRAAFSRKPFAAVKLKKDILEPSGVSVGSFYHQFRDKGDLLITILKQHSSEMREQFSEIHRPGLSRTPERIARDSYALVFDMVDRHTDIIRIQQHATPADDPRLVEFYERDRQHWHDSRCEDYKRIAEVNGDDLDVDFAAELIGMLADGAIRHYTSIPRAQREAVRERLIDGLVQLTLRGLSGLSAPVARNNSDAYDE